MTRNCIWMGEFSQVVTLPLLTAPLAPACRSAAASSAMVRPARPRSNPPVDSSDGQSWPGPGRPGRGGLVWPGGVRVAGQGPVELAAGADAELGEDLAQVV